MHHDCALMQARVTDVGPVLTLDPDPVSYEPVGRDASHRGDRYTSRKPFRDAATVIQVGS
ncbi:hypothetical protein GCM10010431_10110 [Streptomyces kunmingensis]